MVDTWNTDAGLPQNTVKAVCQSSSGFLWIATFDGLARFDGVRFTVFNRGNTPHILGNRIDSFICASDGDVWAGTEDLNDLVPADSTLYMVFATWINDVGQITGYGLDQRANEIHGFLASLATGPLGMLTAPGQSPVFPAEVRNQLRQRLAHHPGIPRQ